MAMIYKTTQADGHWHAVYVDQKNGVFLTSKDMDHEHEVVLIMDSQGKPNLVISETEGHKHYLEELEAVLPAKPKTKDANKVVEQALSLFKSADTLEEKSRERGAEAVKFFKGDQWDESARRKLQNENRPCQTINVTAGQIDILSGIMRQNRLDPRAFPVEGSDEGTADVATALLMRISKMSRLATEEIEVFEDGVIPGRGLFNIGISQKKNPLGDIFIERFPWKDGYFGKHEKLDASDATHCHKAKWMSIGEASSRFSDKSEELQQMVQVSGNYPDQNKVTNDKWVDSSSPYFHQFQQDPKIIDKQHQRIRLIEHEIKEFRTANIAVNQDLSLNQEVSKEVARKIENFPMVNVLELPRERIRIVVTAGTALIKQYYPDRPYDGFSLTPYYVYKYDDSEGFNGKVEFMKDIQREINKRSSQLIDAANRTLSPGWAYTDDTFDSEKDKRDWLKNRGKVGHVVKHANDAAPPAPSIPPKFPMELLTMQTNNMQTLQQVTNINPALSGQSSQYQSGNAGMMQRQAGLVGNERVFDNFVLAKQVVMQKVFRLAQEYMSKERIARIVLSEASDPDRMNDLQIGGQAIPMQRNSEQDAEAMQAIIKLLETKDLSQYDITIGEQPLSPTMKEFERKSWMEAQMQGVPVPPELMVELSSLPNKGKWARIMAQKAEEARQMEMMKYQTELQKAGRIPVGGQNNNTGGSQ